MKIIDERYQVADVAERWKEQYFTDGRWRTCHSDNADVIYQKLNALDSQTATAADVAKIIGNSSWVGPSDCHECNQTVARTVQLGQEPNCESSTAQICENCLRKALALIAAESMR
jgi:hypothetical protein